MAYLVKKNENPVIVRLEVDLIRDGKYIVAYCPSLELTSFGKTNKEAKKSFEEALNIFLEYSLEHGTLETNLLNLGWNTRRIPHTI